MAEFHELGLGDPAAISAAHGDGVRELIEVVLAAFPERSRGRRGREASARRDRRPAERRQVHAGERAGGRGARASRSTSRAPRATRSRCRSSATAGATRWSTPPGCASAASRTAPRWRSSRSSRRCRRSRRRTSWCWCSMRCEGITEQDAHIAGYILERGRAVVVAVNKWDAADKDARERVKTELARKLGFLDFAERRSSRRSRARACTSVLRSVDAAFAAAMAKLLDAEAHARADRRGRAPAAAQARAATRARRCATRTRAASNPPRVIIHGNALRARARRLQALPRGLVPRRVQADRARRCASNCAPAGIPTRRKKSCPQGRPAPSARPRQTGSCRTSNAKKRKSAGSVC